MSNIYGAVVIFTLSFQNNCSFFFEFYCSSKVVSILFHRRHFFNVPDCRGVGVRIDDRNIRCHYDQPSRIQVRIYLGCEYFKTI